MKANPFFIVTAVAILFGYVALPAEAGFICDGSVIDDTGTACDGTAIGLRIGFNADGSLEVNGGSDFSVTNDGTDDAFMHVGRNGNNGTLVVTGSGSYLTVDGGAGHGQTTFGRDAGSNGDVTIKDGASLTVIGQDARIFVGREGTADFKILNGGSVLVQGIATDTEDTGIQIARDTEGGDGQAAGASVTVDNGSMTVTAIDAFINVGTDGDGHLTVRNGGNVTVNGGTGFGFLGVGRNANGDGELTIESGGQVNVTSGSGDSSVYVANGVGSLGTVIVDGATSKLDAGSVLGIGIAFDNETAGGTGTVNVRNDGEIVADAIYVGGNGFLGGNGTVTGDVFNRGGTLQAGLSPGTLNFDGDLTQESGILEVEIRSLTAGNYDIYNVDGIVNFFGGSILFIFLDGFLPKSDDIVNFLLADDVVGLGSLTLDYRGAAPGFEFNLVSNGAGGLQFVALNDAIAVPEPATIMLFGAGLLGLGLLVRRRKA